MNSSVEAAVIAPFTFIVALLFRACCALDHLIVE
jgi:hypothetical protein